MTAPKTLQRFKEIVDTPSQVGVSEFARSKGWRAQLSEEGCLEVIERGKPIGVVLSPEYASVLENRIAELEQESEQAVVEEMFAARAQRTEYTQGKQLEQQATRYLAHHAHEIETAVNSDNE